MKHFITNTITTIICLAALTGCASTVLGMVASAGGSYVATKELDSEKNTSQASFQKNYVRHPVNSFELAKAPEPIVKAPEIRKIPQNNDERVTAIITSRFISGELTKILAIQTQVQDGVVTLSGTVPSQVIADRAVSVARNISGVTEVISNIKVLNVELRPKLEASAANSSSAPK